MVKRYIMPCFSNDNHRLVEDPDGYIIQSSDYDSLVTECRSLKEQIADLKKQLEEATASVAAAGKASTKKKKSGPKFGLKTPIDEEEWIWVTDLSTNEIIMFDSKTEAEVAGPTYGLYRVEKL